MSEKPQQQRNSAEYAWQMTKKTLLGIGSLAFGILGAIAFYSTALWMFWAPFYGLICAVATALLMTVAFFLFKAAKNSKTEIAFTSDGAKPKKRIVSKGQYALLETQRTALTTVAIHLFVLCGLSGFACQAFFAARMMGWAMPCLGMASATLLLGVRLVKSEQKIERTLPLTQKNTSDLPAVQTLVRPSDIPPSHQSSELLRSAPQGSETPPEEMLRAEMHQ